MIFLDTLSLSDDAKTPSREEIYSLAERCIDAAREKELLLGCAESCTGGLVSAAITEVPGSSDVMQGGICSYAFSAKTSVLGVKQETLDSVGAVSVECAEEMARGARRVLDADIAVSTTGIAGPGGEVPGKPVGTVCFGVAYGTKAATTCRHFSGDRAAVRAKSVAFALELLCGAIAEF